MKTEKRVHVNVKLDRELATWIARRAKAMNVNRSVALRSVLWDAYKERSK